MGNNTSLLTAEPWTNGVKSQVSFDYSPKYQGSQNHVFRGNAYRLYNYNSVRPVVVKCRKNETGTNETWRRYLKSASDVATFAITFNQDIKNMGLSYKISVVCPTDVCLDSIALATKLCHKLRMHKKQFHEDEIVVFEEYLGKTLLTFTDERGQLCCNDATILDTFAHYIYEESNHTMTVSNMRGARSDNIYELVIPHLNTKTGDYGNRDRGMAGISDFLKHHRCNELCKKLVKARDNFTYTKEPTLPPYS